MPLYDFECATCGKQVEQFLFLAELDAWPKGNKCQCGGTFKRVLTPGHGGVQSDTPLWLNSQVREALQDSDRVRARLEKPIETRGEWKRHLKDKGMVAVG